MIFDDDLAVGLAGAEGPALGKRLSNEIPRTQVLAFSRWVCVRSRFAEDLVTEAMARGIEQYVILGAGLDSFAYRRGDLLDRLRVFEVDHPASQGWKRRRLKRACRHASRQPHIRARRFREPNLARGTSGRRLRVRAVGRSFVDRSHDVPDSGGDLGDAGDDRGMCPRHATRADLQPTPPLARRSIPAGHHRLRRNRCRDGRTVLEPVPPAGDRGIAPEARL